MLASMQCHTLHLSHRCSRVQRNVCALVVVVIRVACSAFTINEQGARVKLAVLCKRDPFARVVCTSHVYYRTRATTTCTLHTLNLPAAQPTPTSADEHLCKYTRFGNDLAVCRTGAEDSTHACLNERLHCVRVCTAVHARERFRAPYQLVHYLYRLLVRRAAGAPSAPARGGRAVHMSAPFCRLPALSVASVCLHARVLNKNTVVVASCDV